MKRSTKFVVLLTLIALLVGVGIVAASDGNNSPTNWNWWQRSQSFTIEVAENGTRYVPDAEPVDADGLQLYGGEFITQGYIYPDGTLTCDSDNNCNGVNPDGTPEFPDKVIGLWTCRGWHVNDGATTTTGLLVITTQTYAFTDDPTAQNITTDGFEIVDYNKEFERSIVGGTGAFRRARGEQIQELLGWNQSIGVGLRVTFNMRR